MAGAAIMSDIERVTVALGARAYDILVGHDLIAETGSHLARACAAKRVAVVTDETVARLYLSTVEASLERAGLAPVSIKVADGEASKSFATLERVLDSMLDHGLERQDAVLALGGGVVGDLAGLAASLLKRGVALIQCPTTLLAQVDSSVGGKTAIDTRHGKNLVGAFYQPRLVIADTGVLDTLPARLLRAGYAEIVKYGLIDDAPFFAWLEENGARVLGENGEARRRAIVTSCRAKARVVAADERETEGPRALLNLGHSFGHALEAALGYGDRLLHGEAVAIGLGLAFGLSAEMRLAPPDDARRVVAHLRAVGLPSSLAEISGRKPALSSIMAAMAQDKKIAKGRLTLILARGIGRAFLARDVELQAVERFLAHRLS
jgi:3-dehydroquinate synthase